MLYEKLCCFEGNYKENLFGWSVPIEFWLIAVWTPTKYIREYKFQKNIAQHC